MDVVHNGLGLGLCVSFNLLLHCVLVSEASPMMCVLLWP